MEIKQLQRPILFPLKLKLISLFSLVLLISLAAYAQYALTKFIEDKSAYIFNSVQDSSRSISRDILNTIQESKRTLHIMGLLTKSEDIKNIFDSSPSFIDYRIFDLSKNKFTTGILDHTGLSKLSLSRQDIDKAIDQNWGQITSSADKTFFYFFKNKPVITIVTKLNESIQIAQISLVESLVQKNNEIDNLIMSPGFETLTDQSAPGILKQLKDEYLAKGIKKGVFEANFNDQLSLISFEQENLTNPISISIIKKSAAFSVADKLIKQSYIYAVFLLSLAIIIVILFSRSLTKYLETLFEGTQKFVAGDFENSVEVKSRDEIGALSDSFNYMGKKIVQFMEQMKEKVRLEREVEVAKLVQDSFFPNFEGTIQGAEFSAFYAPASECGGDWWGYIESNGKSAIFIADATGHGVPAALITATANCALHTLEELLKTQPELIVKPNAMLEWFNKAICGAGKQLYMTMLCTVVDKETKTLTWSNAAHNPPYLLSAKIDQPSRQDLIPLLSEPSAHLGKEHHSTFENKQISYEEGDLLVLYTDGIVENTNKENKPYGDRKFHTSITQNKNSNLKLWQSAISSEALTFSGGTPSDDDVTLVLCRLVSTHTTKDIEFINNNTVISHLDAKESIDFLCENTNVDHLIGHNSPILSHEIELNAPSIGTPLFSWQGQKLEEYRNEIDLFLKTKEFPGWFQSPRDYLSLIGDELVTNAFSDKDSIVSVNLSVDDSFIMIEVQDNKGMLTKDQILQAFKRAKETQSPKQDGRGAGLGLYLVYQSTNQIWIDIHKNQSTTIKCVLEATKRYKNFKGRVTSFHFKVREIS